MSDFNAVPDFDSPMYYQEIFDVPEQPEYEVDKAVFILNDWTGGQFHVFRKPDDVHLMYFYRLAAWVGTAEKYGYDKLDENGRYVATELRQRIPIAIRKLKGQKAPKTKPHLVPKAKPTYKAIPGYVYLLQSPTTAYKIGRASNPANRMRTFGIQLPFEVEFICLIKTDDMIELERRLHTRFEAKRINGEWFALDPEDVEYIKVLAT